MILTTTACISCFYKTTMHFGFQQLIIDHYHMEFKITDIYFIILLESTQHHKKKNQTYSKYTKKSALNKFEYYKTSARQII